MYISIEEFLTHLTAPMENIQSSFWEIHVYPNNVDSKVVAPFLRKKYLKVSFVKMQ